LLKQIAKRDRKRAGRVQEGDGSFYPCSSLITPGCRHATGTCVARQEYQSIMTALVLRIREPLRPWVACCHHPDAAAPPHARI
jgi:hypothetical protein